jgi:phenylacetate-CoA ligase
MKPDWYDRLIKHPLLLPAQMRSVKGGVTILAVLEQYRVTERLDPVDLNLQQRTLLAALARHAADQSAHFAHRLSAAGLTPETLAEPGGLSRLPPMTRQELAGAKDALFCRATPPEHGRIGTTSTSGSTGEPVTLRRTELCELHWSAHTIREHLWHERDFSKPLAVIRANATTFSRYTDWGAPCDRILRTGQALVMPPSRAVGEILDRLVDFQPGYLLVLPAILAEIATLLASTGQRLDCLRGIRTLSETVSPRLREEVRRLLGLGIDDVYSSQEGGVMATQCPEEGRYHVAETILMEVVDAEGKPCAPGQIGRILITDLINFATPLIRYEIGDYAEVGAPCPCGRGLPAIQRFLGRERNLVLLPDGTRHWPVVGFHRWGEVHPIRQFQFTQLDRRTIEANLSATGQPTEAQQTRLTEIIREELGYPFEVRYVWHEGPIPRGPGGKFEEFVCRAQ